MGLPIGVSNFKKLIEYKNPLNKKEGYLYVDKTLFIREILGDGSEVIIITRPRRFGKTINLSMLRYFYASEVNNEPTADLFKNLEITKHDDCMQYQGKHPVIFISLKDIKYNNYDSCIEKLHEIMSEIYETFRKQLYSDKLSVDEKEYVNLIIKKSSSVIELENSAKRLLVFLNKYYGVKPVLLIDEYDTPIQQSYIHDYYDEFLPFFRNFLSSALKDSDSLSRGILTGILRVSKESLFSDLNNVEVYSVLNNKYSEYFGFNQNEVEGLLEKTELSTHVKGVKEWYNGYNFGDNTLYNPWSILKFIKSKGELEPYWLNTSGNDLIKKIIIKSEANTQEKISLLLSGGIIKETIDEHIVFKDLEKNRSAIWGLFLMSGYLKVIEIVKSSYSKVCKLAIPNKEIELAYEEIAKEWLHGDRGISWYEDFITDLIEGRIEEFGLKMQDAIDEMVSYYDANKRTQETFYHGVMLGILAGLKDTHEVKSNRESGRGRYDLIIIPKDASKLGIVMEFKSVASDADLDAAAIVALEQIIKSKYSSELRQRGIKDICEIGISFSGKETKIKSRLPDNFI